MLQPVNYNGKKVHGSIARSAQGTRKTTPKLYPGNTDQPLALSGTKTDINKIVRNVVRNCIEFLSEMILLVILVRIMFILLSAISILYSKNHERLISSIH